MSGRKPSWWQMGFGAVIAIGLFFAALISYRQGWAEYQANSSWALVYSATFDSLDGAVWTVNDIFNTGYQWGVTAYPVDSATDYGLWAAGGGTKGSLQDWNTDTYPAEFMATKAMAGPFTPEQGLTGVRLTFDVLNKITDVDDVLTFGISYDGVNFVEEIQVPADRVNWQHIVWSPAAVTAQPVWVGFRFFNDGADVDTGPLVDNLILEFKYENLIYLPNVLNQPTLTPSPTPTATPVPYYLDDFTNASSGWFTGDAWRENWRDLDGDGKIDDGEYVWEVVATMSYVPEHYQIYVPLTFQGGGNVSTWFVWPAEKAPMPASFYEVPDQLPANYCVEARAKIVKTPGYSVYASHWGIVFGANAERTELYNLQVNTLWDYAVLHQHNYVYPGDREADGLNVENELVPWIIETDYPFIQPLDYNTLKAIVVGDDVRLYINGIRIDQIDPLREPSVSAIQNIPNLPKAWVGVIGGSWEGTPTTVQFDYFKYTTDPAYCAELP